MSSIDVSRIVRKYGIDRLPNVVGWSNKIQKKIVKGIVSDIDCIRIYVSKKLPREMLRRDELIPEEVDGIKTDVVEVGRLRKLDVYTGKYRPTPCGVSTGRADTYSAGTIGWWLIDQDFNLYLMSNNHVWANENQGQPGDPLIQPSLIDGGDPDTDVIAYLVDYVPLKTDVDNLVDVAVADMSHLSDKYATIMEVGGVIGVEDPVEGMEVVKVGRTTGLTRGIIIDSSATIRVEYDMGILTFTDVFIVQGNNIAKPGDSGSPVLNNNKKFLGLLFAGNDEGSMFMACKARNIETEVSSRLGRTVRVLTTNAPPPGGVITETRYITVEKVVKEYVYPPYADAINAILGSMMITSMFMTIAGIVNAISRLFR